MSGQPAPIRILEFEPLPCRHEAKSGKPHASNAALIRCLSRNGIPGFKVKELRP